MTRIALFVVLLSACKIRNEQSCDIEGVCVDTDGGGQACTSSSECDVGVCKLPDGFCVGCLESTDCEAGSVEPVCNTTTNSCEGCSANPDCPSQACNVTTGECFAATDVAYVVAGGTGTCGQNDPCGSVTEAVTTGLPVIKIQGTEPVIGATKVVISKTVLVIGDRGATLPVLQTGVGPTFEVQNASLTIRDVELSGLVTNTTSGGITMVDENANVTLDHVFVLNHALIGVSSTMGNKLVMRGCVVAKNKKGGLGLADVSFEITNTIIANNGATDSNIGGMRATGTNNAANCLFEFNTVAENSIKNEDQDKGGVDCAGTSFPAHNNIVAGVANTPSLDPTCKFDHSLFTALMPVGMGNKMVATVLDLRFKDRAIERGSDYYRIQNDSPATDSGLTSMTTTVDIDGQSRPLGAAEDMGADEVMP